MSYSTPSKFTSKIKLGADFSPYLPYIICSIFFCLVSFLFESPADIWKGMLDIFSSPGVLVTDYIFVADKGSAFMNAGLMALLSCTILLINRIPFNGAVSAAIFTMAGFSFFGKNLINSLPIMFGVFLYSKFMRQEFRQHILISLFGTSLAPLVSSTALLLRRIRSIEIQPWHSFILAIIIGLTVGFIMPTLASSFMRFHQGYNLYNAGFTAGIIGLLGSGLLNYFGLEIQSTSLVYNGPSAAFAIILLSIFIFLFATALLIQPNIKKLFQSYTSLLNDSGRLISDFSATYGLAATFMNMSLNGLMAMTVVLLLGGTLSGPVIGGILCITGFSAFGKHPRNCFPVMLGVIVMNIFARHETSSTLVLTTLLFGTTLSPISGRFGSLAGFIAGNFHMALILKVGILHEGVNLYNNGFSGGFVAAILPTLLEHFQQSRFSFIKFILRSSKPREFAPAIWQIDNSTYIPDISDLLKSENDDREKVDEDEMELLNEIIHPIDSEAGKTSEIIEESLNNTNVGINKERLKYQRAKALNKNVSAKDYERWKNFAKEKQTQKQQSDPSTKSKDNLSSSAQNNENNRLYKQAYSERQKIERLQEREHIANIANELIAYFQYHNIDDYILDIKRDIDRDRIIISGVCPIAPEGLKELRRNLNRGRDKSLEGYYEQLLSIYDEGDEMPLLSVMIDGAKVHHSNGRLEIEVWRLS